MTTRIDEAAAVAARARAEQARAKAAEAAKKAAAVAAKAKQASAAAKRLKSDDFSTGRAKALRVKSLALGTPVLSHLAPPPAAQTPTQKAKADADRITEQAKTDPAGAAVKLKQAMSVSDPAYHAALVDAAKPVVEQIAKSIKKASPDQLAGIVTSLGEISQLAGPEAARALGETFASNVEGGLGGFDSLGGMPIPQGPGSAAFLTAMLNTPGMGDFVVGMIDGAKATGNLSLLKDLSGLIEGSATLANKSFEDAQQKVDQLNSELNALVQGFGPGDEKKLQAAIDAFKKRHEKEYAALDTASKAMTNVLELAGPVLEQSKDFGLNTTLLKSLSLAPQVLATEAGQAELGRSLDAQARGEPSPLLDTLTRLTEGKDGEKLRDQLAPLLTQALGTRITALKADGRTDEAHALIGLLSQNSELFDVPAKQLGQLQDALDGLLDDAPGAMEDLQLAMSSVGPFLKEGSGAATALKGLGLVVGLAGLGKSFDGFTTAQLQDQIGTLTSTLGLGVDGASLALKVLGSPASQASLEKLFGKVSTVTGVIGAVVGVIDFARTAENGSIGDVAVSGLNAASGVLLLIPGGQIAGVGLAIASFALNSILADRRQQKAESSSEKDALAFLKAAGLDEDFAKVFSNLDNDKRNLGTFVDEVAKKLGLTRDEFFEKLNAATGKDREELISQFKGLSAAAEVLEEFDAGGQLPIFGPPLTIEDLSGLPDWISTKDKQKIVDGINARRAEIVDQVAGSVEDLLD